MTDDFFTIVDALVRIPTETGKKFHKELNLISWRGRPPVYDFRGWNEDRSEMTKGITLTGDELKLLKEKLGGIEL